MSAKSILNFDAIAVRIQGGEQAGLRMVVDLAAQKIRGSMYETKHGVKYPGSLSVSSAPGEHGPAVQSGALEERIKGVLTSKSTATVYANDDDIPEKAIMFEMGSGNIAPRPIWAQVVEECRTLAPEILAEQVKQALR